MGGQSPKYGQGNPDAIRVAPGSSLVWALRGIPYTASTAAADVIDNSIAARAKHIWILNSSAQEPMDSYVAFVDDGHGMSESELHKAMIHGSKDPRMDRGEGDFGRFGLGLKTASLSQGRRLTVWSKSHGQQGSVRQWDLDLQGEDDWTLFSTPQRPAERDALDAIKKLTRIDQKQSGTIVLWSCLDVLLESDRTFNKELIESQESLPLHEIIMNKKVTELVEHAAIAFHRFLGPIDHHSTRLKIARMYDNGSVHELTPWDPFLQGKEHDRLPVERPPQQRVLRGEPGEAIIQPVILPHESNVPVETWTALAGGPKGMNSRQGFYVYRLERLIVAGDWLGLYAPEIHYSLGRIAIFLDNNSASDKAWSIKVNKESVQIPAAAQRELVKIAKSTRKRSNDVFRRVGQVRGSKGESIKTRIPLWAQKRIDLDGERMLQFKINRNHPLIKVVAKDSTKLGSLLSALESGVPYDSIKNLMSDGERLTEAPDPVVALSNLREVVESLRSEGVTACDTLLTVSRDIAPYNGPAFAVAVGLLRAELGCKIPKRTSD